MNKVEKAKLEKDGLDVFPELMRAARDGWETLEDNDLMRLKWYGLYPHNTGDGYFMLRTKVVQGVLTADQAEVMAGIAEEFGRGIIDCTTRQCFSLDIGRVSMIRTVSPAFAWLSSSCAFRRVVRVIILP